MTQGSDYFGIYQVWLGYFLTEDLVIDADRVQHLQRHHHRPLPIYKNGSAGLSQTGNDTSTSILPTPGAQRLYTVITVTRAQSIDCLRR